MSAIRVFVLAALPVLGAGFSERFAEIRDGASPQELYSFLYALPKGGDLHHHAGLSFFADSALEVALLQAKHGYRYYTRTSVRDCGDGENDALLYANLPAVAWGRLSACRQGDYTELEALTAAQKRAWVSALVLDAAGEGRNEFFEEIVPRLSPLLRNPHFFAEGFARNLVAFGKEGVRYLEAQWNPVVMQRPDGSAIPVEETLAIFRARMGQADVRASGVTYRFQSTVIRFRDDLDAQVAGLFAFVDAHRDLWVGINAAGREDNDKGYALRMLAPFRAARRKYAGIHVSLHAGERDSPGREVRDSLLVGAERIGHGVNLISDPEGMLLMRGGRHLVEISLVSNRLLGYTPDLGTHPFPEYLRFGIPVCLNTDDRGSWDSNMTDEYMHAVPLFKLSWEEVVKIGRDSLVYSFAPEGVKARMLAEYERDVAAFVKRFGGADWRGELAGVKAEVSRYGGRTFLGR